ncbi:MAG: sulfatase [Myxococcota bacterium]
MLQVDLRAQIARRSNDPSVGSIDLGTESARSHLGEGWARPEREPSGRTFVWALGDSATLRLGTGPNADLLVRVVARPGPASDDAPAQRMTVHVNGERLQELEMRRGFAPYHFQIPAKVLSGDGDELTFHFDRAVAPRDVDPGSEDDRRLAVAFDRVDVSRADRGDHVFMDADGLLHLPKGDWVSALARLPAGAAVRFAGVGGSAAGVELTWERTDHERRDLARVDPSEAETIRPLPGERGEVGRLRLRAMGGDATIEALELWGAPEGRLAVEERPSGETPDRPHVLVFLVDTLRRDRLGAYGYDRPTSPHFDAFCDEAVRFEHAIAQSPWTSPSVASMFTGLHPLRHGLVRIGGVLPDTSRTMAEILSEAGYQTVAFSASAAASSEGGFAQGFEQFEEFVHPRRVGPDSPVVLDALEKWLRARDDDRPLFLYVHVVDPHSPYAPTGGFGSRFAPDTEIQSLRASRTRPELLPAMEALYDGDVAMADAAFGRFLESLERHGLYQDAVTVFVADHGEQFLEHGGLQHKALFGEVVDIPLAIRLPGERVEGHAVRAVAQHVDLLPTVAALTGSDAPPWVEGRDLGPLLRGAKEPPDRSPPVHSYVLRAGYDAHSVVQWPWKLIMRRYESHEERFLYDLASDPGETRLRTHDEPLQAAWLESRMGVGARSSMAPADPPDDHGVDPGVRRRLEALGYAQ